MSQPPPPLPPAAEPVEQALAGVLSPPRRGLEALARRVLRLLAPILLAAAAAVLWREFHHLRLAEVTQAMAAWGPGRIFVATILSILSFALMGAIEWVGLRWTGAQVPWLPAMGVSFIANAVAHSIGANLLVSGAIRARLYERYGVNLIQTAGATLFAAMSFAVGISALSGAGLLLASPDDLAATAIPPNLARALGGALVAFVTLYVAACGLRRRPLTAFGRSLTLPSFADALVQLVTGVVDNGVAAAILWVLLPAHAAGFGVFVGAYAVACVAGLASSVPGGAGVFESALATLLPAIGHAALAAAFLGFRLLYYLAPLALAAIALGADTLRPRKA